MTNFELRKRYPNHWFVKVIHGEYQALLAVKKDKQKLDRPIASMPGMTIDMLAGATIRIGEGMRGQNPS